MTQKYRSFLSEEFRLHNEKLQTEMEKRDIDMFMLSTPGSIYHSTGHRSWYVSSLLRPVYVLAPRKGDPAIILRILEKATVQYTSWTSRTYCRGTTSRDLGPLEGGEPISIIDRIIKEIQSDTGIIGLGAGDGMQYFWSMELLKKITDSQPDICSTDGSLTIQRVRMVKTPWETERIRYVCRITEQAMLETGKTIVAGETTEEGISKGIAMCMARGGVDKISYLTVTNGVDKHYTFSTYTTDRMVRKGEYVLVGINGHIDGCVPDFIRVSYLGTMSWGEREMATTASGYVAVAKEAMKPGVSIVETDRTYEGYIRDPRFGKFLLHSSGHCTGLNMVEYPTIHDEASGRLKPGMVFAVGNGVHPYNLEKGVESIYLSFRMEDEVLATKDGVEWITSPGELVIEVGANH